VIDLHRFANLGAALERDRGVGVRVVQSAGPPIWTRLIDHTSCRRGRVRMSSRVSHPLCPPGASLLSSQASPNAACGSRSGGPLRQHDNPRQHIGAGFAPSDVGARAASPLRLAPISQRLIGDDHPSTAAADNHSSVRS